MARERILIVDGDITLMQVLKARLEAMGYLVDCARTARAALDILKRRWVDMVILSLLLQGATHGFQLFRAIKKKRKLAKVPIIIQTGKPAMKKVFAAMGAYAYFVKPYPIKSLLMEIERYFQKGEN